MAINGARSISKAALLFLALTVYLSTSPVRGQESNATASAPQDLPKPFQWNAELDGYVEENFNHPSSGANALRSFDTHSDAFRLAGSSVDLDYKTDYIGAHLTAGYGDLFGAIAATDRLKGANSYLSQFYITYKPIQGTGLQLDLGKFYTSVGAEVPDTQVNFNYSRSLLFALGEPYYHAGLRATIPVTKTFTVGAQLLNGWNNLEGREVSKTFGFTTVLTKNKWSWSQVFLLGAEKNQTSPSRRQLANEVLTLTPRPSIQAYVELLYGRDGRVSAHPGVDSWYGAALAIRWNKTKKLSLAPRLEYYVDQTGFTSGTPQHLREVTATAEYKLTGFVTTRLEFREDFSDRRFFERGHDAPGMQQASVILGILVYFKGER